MTETPDTQTINAFNQALAEEFRANGGKVGGQFENANLLLLTTTGAKSGQSRLSPLAYFDVDGRIIVLGSFGGSPKDPAWVHNLRANPRAHVEVGAEAFDVAARELPDDERAQVLPKVTEKAPVFAEYQAKTTRVIPLFELQRT
ncbi:deazaflavin-dependent nitroreductase [Mycobacterium sp. E2462]|uniref:nitroreductase family deazaflavin-dependent oxidoreductase n=1 Tax=unclassified Mycobacterium TaxID=2642494 RepID=UPI0007FDD20B|nr:MULTISPECIES: nitroreductase family deazaflavin-dependent oxidoreductase [unclassified Mycobacterium]OBG75281.1 deazaflavin-dependent nitroreductase [Mycobacterium sp. E1214]OBH28190.1 deazaflavin-dependent nitroreductase [Mycobacterium sp. E1319]OBI07904.1 deazaflavin-dependent nitroreductase [Mycobacterium sp. E2462]